MPLLPCTGFRFSPADNVIFSENLPLHPSDVMDHRPCEMPAHDESGSSTETFDFGGQSTLVWKSTEAIGLISSLRCPEKLIRGERGCSMLLRRPESGPCAGRQRGPGPWCVLPAGT